MPSRLLRKKLFYPKSEIEGPFVASPGDLIDAEGNEYTGLYVKAGGQILSGNEITSNSKVLRSGTVKFKTPNTTRYFQITELSFDNHILPEYFYPEPTEAQYKRQSLTRYFVQKINEPATTITEIDKSQYNKWNQNNSVGIDGNLYRRIQLDWTIAGPDTITNNRRVLAFYENEMPGISRYLSDLNEFNKQRTPIGYHYMPDGTLMKNEDHKDNMMTIDSMPASTTTTTSSPIRSSTTSTSTGASVGY